MIIQARARKIHKLRALADGRHIVRRLRGERHKRTSAIKAETRTGAGGGGVLLGDNFDGGNFGRGRCVTSRNPETCRYFPVGSGMVPLTSNAFQSALHVANKHICGPSLRLAHRCTCLNSQYSRASEFAVNMLVTRREGGREKISPLFLTAQFSRENLPSRNPAPLQGRTWGTVKWSFGWACEQTCSLPDGTVRVG